MRFRSPASAVFVVWMLVHPSQSDAQVVVAPPLWSDADMHDIPEPAERETSELFGILYNSWLRHLDVSEMHGHRPSLNVNAWDEVPESSWFTNRIGRRPMDVEEFLQGGPGVSPEPGRWEVQELKTEGYTVGFEIIDSADRRYVLKFDRPEAPERNSAAEKIGSLIVHAAGYHVPHYSIVHFRADELVVGVDATFEDETGRERPMEQVDLEAALASLVVRPDGSYRGIASLFLEGVPVGPFAYSGTRDDDPNDIIPHELRREIRGFQVLASWINHVDVKEANTFDAYVTEDDRRYVRHHFIDFGSTMGSGDFVNGPCRVGHEYMFDGAAIGKSFVTLGAWERPWEVSCNIAFPEVGRFEGEFFDAATWKPNYPNLAFRGMGAADGYWGAKVVTAFDDDLVQALAEAGDYSRPEVEQFVAEAFRMRRDKIGEYWFDRVTPLEAFELETIGETTTLSFRDLAVERGLAAAETRRYIVEAKGHDRLATYERKESTEVWRVEVTLTGVPPTRADQSGRVPTHVVEIRSSRDDGSLALPVRVVIGLLKDDSEPRVLGWAHAPGE